MPKFLAGWHYNEEELAGTWKKEIYIYIGCWPVQINGNKFAASQILKKLVEVVKGRILAGWAQKSREPCTNRNKLNERDAGWMDGVMYCIWCTFHSSTIKSPKCTLTSVMSLLLLYLKTLGNGGCAPFEFPSLLSKFSHILWVSTLK